MRAHTITTTRPALLLSLLALGALGLLAFEGGDAEATAKSETETAGEGYVDLRPYYSQASKTRAVDRRYCGSYGRWNWWVEGDISCRAARRVIRFMNVGRAPELGWICGGGDARPVCFHRGNRADGIKIIGRFCADWHSRHPCSGGPEIPPLPLFGGSRWTPS
jgi:hypothetical protein